MVNKGKIYDKFKRYIISSSEIEEISARNEVPVKKVKEIYSKFNRKVYSKWNSEKNSSKNYDPLLQRQVFELTEKYLDREKIRELMNLYKTEGKDFEGIKIPKELSELVENVNLGINLEID